MFRLKIILTVAIIIFLFGMPIVDYAAAAEKSKCNSEGAFFNTKSEQFEVGDEEGHIIRISEMKGFYTDKHTGERVFDRTISVMDFNIKTGLGSVYGYGIETKGDGCKLFRSFKGEPSGKTQWKGKWKIIKCTGKLKGTKGGGNWVWTSYDLEANQGYQEMKGELQGPE